MADYWDQFGATTGQGLNENTSAGGGGEDPFTVFQQLMQGKPITLESMQAIEAELRQRTGASLVMNARGNAADLRYPNGQIRDVVQNFDGPVEGRSIYQGAFDSGGGNGGAPPGFSMGQTGGQYPLSSVQGPGFMQPFDTPFQAPTGTDDPGFAFAMSEGQKALERSAAARGTLLTGGTLKELAGYSTGMALQGYGDAWNRARTSYLDANNIYNQNRQFQTGLLGNLASQGLNAASGYSQQASDLITESGNAQAAGTATRGRVWGDTIGDVASTGANVIYGEYLRNRNKEEQRDGGR